MTVSSKREDLIIVGGGGIGREVVWLARDCAARWNLVGLLDDARRGGESICEVPVLGKVADWQKFPNAQFVLAIGAPRVRRAVVQAMTVTAMPRFATLVHPSVRMSEFVEIGAGSIVAAGCMLTTQVRIGLHNILDRMVNIGHDVTTGDFCTVSPLVPVGGNVTIGDGVWVGAGASVRQGLTLGRGSMAGMGAVVVEDMTPNRLFVGSPAKYLKDLEPF